MDSSRRANAQRTCDHPDIDGPFKALMPTGAWRHGVYVCKSCAALFTKKVQPCPNSFSPKH